MTRQALIKPRIPITKWLLGCGVAVPVLYFGSQLLAAPFFAGYNPLRDVASLLGSDRAPYPALFNGGTLLTGLAGLLAALGFWRGLSERGVYPLLVWPSSLALAATGLASLLAGSFPMPDPRHNPAALGLGGLIAGMLLAPPLVTAAIWQQGIGKPIKGLLSVMLLVLVGFVLVRSGIINWNTSAIEGLMQRILALVVFGSIGISSWVLLQGQSR
jgi:hypothetical membrane protein